LGIGDDAPEISITQWIKGEPITLSQGKGKNVFIVEFWATWCPPCIEMVPHMTELQHKYVKDGLVVVGVAGPGRGETVTKVKRFVRKRGDSMAYRVAFDGQNQTYAKYMRGVGAAGLPHAFVVNRQGKLVWHGHPADPQMDEIVHKVLKGKFDLKQASVREKITPLFFRMQRFNAMEDWKGFRDTANEILALDPQNDRAIDAMMYAYLTQENDVAGFRKFVEGFIEKNKSNGDAMQVLATMLLRIDEMDHRVPDLAIKAASLAFESCQGKDCDKIGTYARAVYQIGLVDKAIELQSKAIAAADGDDQLSEARRALDFYKACKSLQAKSL